MKTITTVEANGSSFIFEPPVPIHEDEQSIPSLARVATFAWYGAETPYGLAHDLAEDGFEELIRENTSNPQTLSAKLTEVLQLQTQFTVTLVEQ